MCTAVCYDGLFGRNLDLERGFGERVVIMPRNFNFKMRECDDLTNHYAMVGMAAVKNGIPLYFDAMNEKGLSIAGLNFPNNAVYHEIKKDKTNVAPFEFIPFVLGKCECIAAAEKLLLNLNIVNVNFSNELPNSPLHFIVSDGEKSLTVESVKDGLKICKNEIGVLTNNPPFLKQMENLKKYRNIFNAKIPENDGCENFSLGNDALGLPGDFSSSSRFVKAAFIKERSPHNLKKDFMVNHFFHILSSVAMPKGCVLTTNGENEYTRYSSCCDCKTGDYYYTTYDQSERVKVSIFGYDLENINIFQTREI